MTEDLSNNASSLSTPNQQQLGDDVEIVEEDMNKYNFSQSVDLKSDDEEIYEGYYDEYSDDQEHDENGNSDDELIHEGYYDEHSDDQEHDEHSDDQDHDENGNSDVAYFDDVAYVDQKLSISDNSPSMVSNNTPQPLHNSVSPHLFLSKTPPPLLADSIQIILDITSPHKEYYDEQPNILNILQPNASENVSDQHILPQVIETKIDQKEKTQDYFITIDVGINGIDEKEIHKYPQNTYFQCEMCYRFYLPEICTTMYPGFTCCCFNCIFAISYEEPPFADGLYIPYIFKHANGGLKIVEYILKYSQYHKPEECIRFGVGCFLCDYICGYPIKSILDYNLLGTEYIKQNDGTKTVEHWQKVLYQKDHQPKQNISIFDHKSHTDLLNSSRLFD